MSDIVLRHRPEAPLPVASDRPAPDEGELNLRDVRGIVRRNLLVIAGCVGVVVALAVVVTVLTRPVYRASVSLRIDEKQSNLTALDVLDKLAGTEVNTEMGVLHSRTLAAQMADSLGLQLRLDKPRGMVRSHVFRDIRGVQSDTAAMSSSPEASGLAALEGWLKSFTTDPTAYRLERRAPGHYALRHSDSREVIRDVAPGDQLTLDGVTFTFAPTDTSIDRYDFRVLPPDAAAQVLFKSLDVSRPDQTANIVLVTYDDPDRELVAEVPNALVARYVMQRQDLLHAQNRSTVTFLRDQLSRLKVNLAAQEDSLRRFREQQQVVDLPDEAHFQIERAAEMRANRNEIDAERAALQQLLDEVKAKAAQTGHEGPSPYRYLVAFPTLLRSQAASGLLNSLTAAEDRRADLLTRRTAEDPDVKALDDRISSIEQQLGNIAGTYLHGLNDQVNALDAGIQQEQTKLDRLPAKEVQLARLQREPAVLESMYTMLQTRLKEAEIAEVAQDPSVRVVDTADEPDHPIKPKGLLNIVLALMTGGLLGISAAFAREYLDRTIHTRHDMQVTTGLPVLGLIPHLDRGITMAPLRLLARQVRRLTPIRLDVDEIDDGPGGARDRGIVTAGPAGVELWQIAEAYNRLAVNLAFARQERPMQVLLVTSALPGDGKTTVSANLALALAKNGRRVLLIDGDLRRGQVHALFQLPATPGFSDVLAGTVPFASAVRRVEVDKEGELHVLTMGKPPANAAQLHDAAEERALLDRLRGEYELIIVDSPPLNVVSDAALLAAKTDGVILVARSSVTEAGALTLAMDQLRHVRAPVIGTVLNDIVFKRDVHYDPAYKYYGGAEYYTHTRS